MLNEIVIIGAGPAGISCATYLNRLGKNCTLISTNFGGKLNYYDKIKGFFPYDSIKTIDFISLMQDNLNKSIAETKFQPVILIKKVERIIRENDRTFRILCNDDSYLTSKVVVIATGSVPYIPENIKINKKISYYTFEDYPFPNLESSNSVLVLGAGNSAFSIISAIKERVKEILVLDINDNNFNNLPFPKKKKLKEIKNCSFIFRQEYEVHPKMISYLSNGVKEFYKFDKLILCAGEQVTSVHLPEKLKDKSSGKIIVYNENPDEFINMSPIWNGLFAIGDVKKDQLTSNISYAIADGIRTAIAVKKYLD